MKKILIIKILILVIVTFSCLYALEEETCPKEQRLVTVGIIPGGSAATIGLKTGDVIVSYNGTKVHCLNKLAILKAEVVTDSVEIVIARAEKIMSFKLPKGEIGVYIKEVLPDIKFEEDAKIIKGIGALGWDTGESNSFIAALTRVAEYLKIKKDYTYLMGTSGAAFRIQFCEDWCPSSPDPTVGFDCGTIAAKCINLKLNPMFADKEGNNKDQMKQTIKAAINKKMPVIAIDLIELAEWGLIVGYQKNVEDLIVRTYFDKREGYNIAEKFPWIIMTISKEKGKIDDYDNFKNSLKIAQGLYETEKYEKYYSGTSAIEYWIKRLREDDFDSLGDEQFDHVMHTNAWIFERLADDRKFCAKYLKSFANQFPKIKNKIEKLASIYEAENLLMTESGKATLYPMQMTKREDWTNEMKQKEIEILTAVLEKEKEAYSIIKEINTK